MSDTPDQGTGINAATAAIERMFAREDGDQTAPEAPARRPTPAEAPNAEAQQAETEGDKTQAQDDSDHEQHGDDAPAEEAETEAGPEDEAEAENEEAAEEPDPGKVLVTVKLDGKDVQLPLEEVTRGYQRQADYTRKTQALAEERRAFDADAQAVKAERTQYGTLLTTLQEHINTLQGQQQPDWDALYRTDPMEYVRQKDAWRDRQDQARAIEQEKQRLASIQQAEAAQQTRAMLKDERDKLLAARPEWKDGERWKQDQQRIREYGRSIGFSDEQLSGITSHLALLTLDKARRYDEAMSKKPPVPVAPKPKAPPVAPGAQNNVPRAVSEINRAKQRLAKTGSVRDAAALFERLL